MNEDSPESEDTLSVLVSENDFGPVNTGRLFQTSASSSDTTDSGGSVMVQDRAVHVASSTVYRKISQFGHRII